MPALTLEELNQVTRQIESTLGSLMIISKPAALQMEEGFKATIHICTDKLMITKMSKLADGIDCRKADLFRSIFAAGLDACLADGNFKQKIGEKQ